MSDARVESVMRWAAKSRPETRARALLGLTGDLADRLRGPMAYGEIDLGGRRGHALALLTAAERIADRSTGGTAYARHEALSEFQALAGVEEAALDQAIERIDKAEREAMAMAMEKITRLSPRQGPRRPAFKAKITQLTQDSARLAIVPAPRELPAAARG